MKVFGLISDFQLVKEDASRVIIAYGKTDVDAKHAEWHEVVFYKKQNAKPTVEQVRKAVEADINARTDQKILVGFVWNDKKVWLSSENQFNFKAAFDLAMQTEGASLPVKFKLGEDENGDPIYHTFTSINSFKDFYTKAIAFINGCLNEGWEEKDGIDYSAYEPLLPTGETPSAE